MFKFSLHQLWWFKKSFLFGCGWWEGKGTALFWKMRYLPSIFDIFIYNKNDLF